MECHMWHLAHCDVTNAAILPSSHAVVKAALNIFIASNRLPTLYFSFLSGKTEELRGELILY